MAFQHKGSLAFSFSRPTIDPISYHPEDEEVISGDWRRITRTMKGEATGNFGPYLLEWDAADPKARALAEMVDQLADESYWFGVQVLPGLYEVLKHSSKDPARPPADIGVLVCVVPVDGWNPERPAKRVSIDWLDDPTLPEDDSRLRDKIEESIAVLTYSPEIHHIECYSLDTRTSQVALLDVHPRQMAKTPAAA